jgi:hypothetical protein
MSWTGMLKALLVSVMAVAIFYVGGMASLEALEHLGAFEWPVKTAVFWGGGLLLALVLTEATRRIIVTIASFLEEEAERPPLKFEVDEEHDVSPRAATRAPAAGHPPKPASPAKKP